MKNNRGTEMSAIKKTSVTPEDVLRAIPGSHGLIYPLERHLRATRQAIIDCLKAHPEVMQELLDEEERDKDRIMMKMAVDAENGDRFARMEYLKARAVERGFGDRKESSGSGGVQVFLHAAACDLIASPKNGNASKEERLSNWRNRAIEFRDKQKQLMDGKSIEDIAAELTKSST